MRARWASTLPDGMTEGCESYVTHVGGDVRSLLSRERTRIVAGGCGRRLAGPSSHSLCRAK